VADVVLEKRSELGAIIQDLPELSASQDGRRGVRDEVRERAVPIGNGEDRTGRVDDAELEP
jgi:hypothetical protein